VKWAGSIQFAELLPRRAQGFVAQIECRMLTCHEDRLRPSPTTEDRKLRQDVEGIAGEVPDEDAVV
jgi:hypothetical protein